MKITKILSVVLAALMVAVCFVACGNDAADDGAKVLTMATNAEFPPFEYLEDGKMVGAEIDMAYLIAEKLGMELEISNIDFDAALTGAATGKYDMALSGITASEDRKQNMNFTVPYYEASQAIIVMADSELAAAADLEGKVLSCQEGTTGELFILEGNYEVQSYKTGAEAISALTAGKVDAVVIDDAVARALSAAQGGKTKVLDEALTKEEYAIALKKGNDELTDKISAAIEELKAEGKLAEIFDKYELPYNG